MGGAGRARSLYYYESHRERWTRAPESAVDFSEDVLFLSLRHGFVLVSECVILSSRERFNEMHVRMWWEENRSRVHKQYL